MKIFRWLKQHHWLSGIIILLLCSSAWLSYRKFRPKAPQELYQLAPVTINNLTQTVTASGKIKSKTQIDLHFQTGGKLAWLGVQEGDRVRQWQAIAALDKRELQKNLEKYLLDFSKERNDYDEDIKVTYRDKVLTDTISRILQKNEFDLAKAVLDVELKDLALQLATLITPINGVITHLDVPVAGVNVTATNVFTVADADQLIFEAEIDETDIGKIALGQTAKLILDAYPNEPIDLTIDSIDWQSSTDSAGSTIYLIKLKLANRPDQTYRLGMNGEILITTNQKNNVLTVPSEAVVNNQVQVATDKTVTLQAVTVGIESETATEITSGLAAGQLVVIGNKVK